MGEVVGLEKKSVFSPLKDYIELCKPRVVMLMILTSFVGMCLASPSLPSIKIVILANMGIGLCAASAAAINHLADHRIDRLMDRTRKRPVVSGKVSFHEALFLAVILGFAGILTLLFINSLTALLTFCSMIGYAGVYTFYLKHNTSQNIVIGGLAGAAPPLLGWVAVTGSIDVLPLTLVAIIFLWTPPHFWALAIDRIDDYRNAGVPMLPITHGIKHTKKSMVLYTLLLFMVCLLPIILHQAYFIYLLGTVMLNLWFLHGVVSFYLDKNHKHGLRVFKQSIIYLMMLFVVFLVDHYIPINCL